MSHKLYRRLRNSTRIRPSLRDAGWGLLIVGGAAGLSGALGTRLLDLLVAALQRMIGS